MGGDTIVGVFDSTTKAKAALQGLRDAGFPENRLGVLSRDEARDTSRPEAKSGKRDDPTASHWEEGTGIGAATGAVGGLGLGLAVMAGLIPAIGPAVAGGVLVALLASAGAGATVGTVVGGLIGLGVPEEEAQYYEEEFRAGRTIVTVQAAERRDEARMILRRNGVLEPQTTGTSSSY